MADIIFEGKVVSETVIEYVVSSNRSKNHRWIRIVQVLVAIIVSSILFSLHFYFITGTFLLLLVATILLYESSCVVEESILIVRDFGIQLRQKYHNGNEITKFIDKSHISRIFIHEYIAGSTVKFCLAINIRDELRLSLLFHEITPRLSDIQQVYLACVDSILGNDGNIGVNRYQ